MKQLFTVLITVFGLMFATSVVAETYTVVSGDTLGKIAKRYQGVSWPEIYKANSQILKDGPDHIYPGQKLTIPVVKGKGNKQWQKKRRGDIIAVTPVGKKIRISKTGIPVYYYRYPDRNPVGKETNPVPYIEKMKVPEVVRNQFVLWATNWDDVVSEEVVISRSGNPKVNLDTKVFSHLDAMGFGKQGKVVRNVQVMFDDLRPAKYSQMDYEGIRYYLICDQQCYNWSCFSEPILVVEQLVKIVPAGRKVKVEKKNLEPTLVNKKSSLASRHSFSPDVEAWLYGGISKGVDNNIGDTGQYYGVSVSAWLDEWQIGNGSFRVGPSYQYVAWDGTAGNVDYNGYFSLIGAEAQYITGNTKDQLKVLFGKKTGYVYGNGFPYYAHEIADLIALEGAHQWWNSAKNYQAELGFRAEIATNNDKSSTWEDHIIPHKDDPALNQSMYLVRGKYTWTKHENFMPTLEIAGSYRASNHAKAVQIRPGLKLWDETIEPSVHYERGFVDGEQTGSIGANVNIDLSKLGKKVYAWLTSK